MAEENKSMQWTKRKEGDDAYGIVWSLQNIENRTDGKECCRQDLEFGDGVILTVSYSFGIGPDAFPHIKIATKEWIARTVGCGTGTIKLSSYSSVGDTFEFLYYTEEEGKSLDYLLSYSLPTKLELSFCNSVKNQDELEHPLSLISPSSYPDFHLQLDSSNQSPTTTISTASTLNSDGAEGLEKLENDKEKKCDKDLSNSNCRLIPCHRAILAAGSSFFTTKMATAVPGSANVTANNVCSTNICIVDRLSSDFESDARVAECAIRMLYHVTDSIDTNSGFGSIPRVSSTVKMFENLTPDEKLRLILFADKYFLHNVLRFAVAKIIFCGLDGMNLYKVWLTMNSLGDANSKNELQGEIQYLVSRSPHRFFSDLAATLPSTVTSLE